jgi:hypothetical protein
MHNDRVQSTLLVIGRPTPFNTAEEYHLPLPRLRLLPALVQACHLSFAAHHGRQPARGKRLHAALHATFAQEAIYWYRRRQPLQAGRHIRCVAQC